MEPEKLSIPVRDRIRGDLLDAETLAYLEGCGAINWISTSTWQCQVVNIEGVAGGSGVGADWVSADHLSQCLEVSEWAWCMGVALIV